MLHFRQSLMYLTLLAAPLAAQETSSSAERKEAPAAPPVGPEKYKIDGSAEMFRRIRDKGFIYKAEYRGQYYISEELYVNEGKPSEPCPSCGNPTETVSEENYYFKLSAFQDKLLKVFAENPEMIQPETRRNEVLAFVRSGFARPHLHHQQGAEDGQKEDS